MNNLQDEDFAVSRCHHKISYAIGEPCLKVSNNLLSEQEEVKGAHMKCLSQTHFEEHDFHQRPKK